jgi:tRNA dimethylallyltransferase
MKKIHVITGQTATGKTQAALARARASGADIISADSRQVYIHLDIITGKDIQGSQWTHVCDLDQHRVGYYTIDGIRIWGCDIVEPSEHFSSFDFTSYCMHILENTIDNNIPPIVVGGSYLYICNLLYGVDPRVGPNWELREELEQKTVPELQKMLGALDPQALPGMNDSDRKNPRRLIRKIEIAQAGDSQEVNEQRQELFQILSFDGYHFSTTDRMQEVISQRVIARIQEGAIEEVRGLLEQGYSEKDPGLDTIGYKHIMAHLRNELSYDEAISQWTTAEVQYAKRQWTFMKKDPAISWHSV